MTTPTPRPRRPRITRRVLDTLDRALSHYRADLEFGDPHHGPSERSDLQAARDWVEGMKDCIKPVRRRKPAPEQQ